MTARRAALRAALASLAPWARHAPTLAAVAFVTIWSTGFIVARGIAPLADPNLFLAVRFALCGSLFVAFALWRGSRWPGRAAAWRLAGTGALLQGLYLGGGFWAVGEGLQPGLMSLMGALQPPLTALVAGRLYGEGLSRRGQLGLALGVAGVALAVWPGMTGMTGMAGAAAGEVLRPAVLAVAIGAVLAITAGTLLQKGAAAKVDIVTASAVQNAGALAVVVPLAFVLGEGRFVVNGTSLALLAWAVLGLSVGGFTLLIWLVRSGSATRATSLLFLAPPLATIMAWWLFDDALGAVQLVGFGIALAGVWLTRRG